MIWYIQHPILSNLHFTKCNQLKTFSKHITPVVCLNKQLRAQCVCGPSVRGVLRCFYAPDMNLRVSVDKDASVSSSSFCHQAEQVQREGVWRLIIHMFLRVSFFAGSWMGITSRASPRVTSLDSSTSEFCKYFAPCWHVMMRCLYLCVSVVHVSVRVYLFMPARALFNLAAHKSQRLACETSKNPAKWGCFYQEWSIWVTTARGVMDFSLTVFSLL